MVSVDVKHHVYLLTVSRSCLVFTGKNEPTWLLPEDLRLEASKVLQLPEW